MGLPSEYAPGALARQTQAQAVNRSKIKILPTQAPSGARRKRRQALLILRAGTMAAQTRRAPPVKRGPGKAGLWT